MKNIWKNFFALTILFVTQSATSGCDIHNKVANCSSTNLHKVPMLNNTKYIEVRLADIFMFRVFRLFRNMKIFSKLQLRPELLSRWNANLTEILTKVLQLDNNSLTVLDDTSLRQYVRLMNLSIRGNELNKIEIQDNSPIKNILHLDLSSNSLERWFVIGLRIEASNTVIAGCQTDCCRAALSCNPCLSLITNSWHSEYSNSQTWPHWGAWTSPTTDWASSRTGHSTAWALSCRLFSWITTTSKRWERGPSFTSGILR